MPEYAPLYTKKEKMVSVLIHLSWSLPLLFISIYCLWPLFLDYIPYAHCNDYDFITGREIVWYLVLVAYPLIFASGLFLFQGKRNLKILKLGQFPLPNEKVNRRTKYKYGFKAKIKAYIFFTIIVASLIFSVYGYFLTSEILATPASKDPAKCLS